MIINVIKTTLNGLPRFETAGAAGCDLRADLWNIKEKFLFNAEIVRNEALEIECVSIAPGGRALIPTGLQIELPEGYEARIQPRSGLALKQGISIVNSPGCIDSDYRGDIGIILINHGSEPFEVRQGDRIAQMIVSPVVQFTWNPVDYFEQTTRDSAGFGTTGTK